MNPKQRAINQMKNIDSPTIPSKPMLEVTLKKKPQLQVTPIVKPPYDSFKENLV